MANLTAYFPWLKQIGKLVDNGDGSYSPQVAIIAASGGAVPVTAAPSDPAYSNYGVAVAPANAAVVAGVTVTIAGSYRIEWQLGGTNSAAVGNYIQAIQYNAAGTVIRSAILPTPGALGISWLRIRCEANDILRILHVGTAAAGSVVYGDIRAYSLP